MKQFYYGQRVKRSVLDTSESFLKREVYNVNYNLKAKFIKDAESEIRSLLNQIVAVKLGEEVWFLRYDDELVEDKLIGAYDSFYIPKVKENICILEKKGTILKSEYNTGMHDSISHYTDIVINVEDEVEVEKEMASARKNFIDLAENYISSFQLDLQKIEEEEANEINMEKWWKFW